MKKVSLVLALMLFYLFPRYAQPQSENDAKHQVQLILSHTQIHSAVDKQGNRRWRSIPSWGVNYYYELSEKWKIGLNNDIIVEDFQVESTAKNNQEILERRYPIASVFVISRKLDNHFHLLLGLGGEIAESQSFFLLRGGIEYSYYFDEKWELVGNITNDFKWNAYNSWALGLGISRNL